MGCFGGSSAALVNVVQDNVDKKVRRIIYTSSLHGQAAKVLSQSIPTIKLAEIYVINFEGSDILEGEQRHGRIERELLVTCNQTGFVIWGQAQAWDLGESRV